MNILSHFHPVAVDADAVEYLFEPGDTEDSLPSEVMASCKTSGAATDELHRRLASLKYPLALSVAHLLTNAKVVSIVVERRGEVYYRAQLSSHSEECILVQFCESFPDVVGGVDLKRFPEYWEFLNVFRNVTGDIPPYNNIWFGDGVSLRYFDICDNDNYIEGHAQRMGEWNHAIPLLFNGFGDYYLLSPMGKIGFRDHGAVALPLTEEQQRELSKIAAEILGHHEPLKVKPMPFRPLVKEVTSDEFTAAVLAQLPRAHAQDDFAE